MQNNYFIKILIAKVKYLLLAKSVRTHLICFIVCGTSAGVTCAVPGPKEAIFKWSGQPAADLPG